MAAEEMNQGLQPYDYKLVSNHTHGGLNSWESKGLINKDYTPTGRNIV